MTSPRLYTAGLALTAALALAGCGSSTNGDASSPTAGGLSSDPAGTSASTPVPTSSSPASTSPAGASTSSTGGSFPTSATALAGFLANGNKSITSAHIAFSFGGSGTSATAEGDQKLSDGKATSFGLVEKIPGLGTIEIRVIDSTSVYVKSPQNSGSKPWAKVTASTTDTSLKAIYQSIQSSSSLGSLEGVTLFLQAATDLKYLGTTSIDGANTGHYSFVVDTTKLPASFPNKSTIVSSGVKSIPVQIYVDEQGRVRKGTDSVSLGSAKVTVTFALSDFDKPVNIQAPPASQTSTP